MIDRRCSLIRIDLNFLCGLLFHILALIPLHDHLRFVDPDIPSRVNWCVNLNLVVVEVIHELLQLTMRVIPLVIVVQVIRRVVFHRLVLRTRQIRRTLLLLLLLGLVSRLDEGFGGCEAVCGRIEAYIHFVVGHREVRQVHLDHVVAETALFRQLVNLIFVFLLEILNLLLHLLQRQVQLFIQFVQLSVLICCLVVFLCDLIIFFFKYIYSLVKNFNRIFKSVRIWKPILLLELFHVAKVELRDRRGPILRLRVFILYPLCDSINGGVHQLVKINRVLWIQNLVIVYSAARLFKFFTLLDSANAAPKGVLKFPLQFLHFLLLRPQLIVQLDIFGFLFS